MNRHNNHFSASKYKDHLYVIKENISLVHPVYTNDPLNIYLILGEHSALLIDTGCGLYPIRPIIEEIIGDRKLFVVNSHAHWDHVLGNNEFNEVFIHKNEAGIVSRHYDVSYFKDSSNNVVKIYAKQDFLIPPANRIKTLTDGYTFNLGEIEVKIIHAPGHSPGSICLLTNKAELFTSDVAYYGDQFLPQKKNLFKVLETLSRLINIVKDKNVKELYPSHRQTPCDLTLLTDLYKAISNVENLWDTKKPFDFFNAWKIDDPSGKFRFIISRS